MRLSVRSSVDLPQPDGPMNAVTRRSRDVEVDVLQRVELAVVEVELADRHLRAAPARSADAVTCGRAATSVVSFIARFHA